MITFSEVVVAKLKGIGLHSQSVMTIQHFEMSKQSTPCISLANSELINCNLYNFLLILKIYPPGVLHKLQNIFYKYIRQ